MGHQKFGPPPRTVRWKRTVAMIAGGAAAGPVAAAAAAAAEGGLDKAAADHGVIEAVWLLMRLPLAARLGDFAGGLRDCGLDVPDDPGLMDVVGAVADAVDAAMPNNRGRTDLGEMAQHAAHEALVAVVGGRLAARLFDPDPDDVRAEFARVGTEKQFGLFARDFFARFVAKCLSFHLSRVLPDHVGAGRRFRTLADVAAFRRGVDAYCREAAGIVELYSGGWFGKERFYSGGEVSRDAVRKFVWYGMTKLTDELRLRNHAHAG